MQWGLNLYGPLKSFVNTVHAYMVAGLKGAIIIASFNESPWGKTHNAPGVCISACFEENFYNGGVVVCRSHGQRLQNEEECDSVIWAG